MGWFCYYMYTNYNCRILHWITSIGLYETCTFYKVLATHLVSMPNPADNFRDTRFLYPLLYVVHIVLQNRESNLTSLQCRYLIPELTDSLIH